MIHAERSNESLVEAFKNMHVHEEMVPDDNEDTVHEVLLSSMIDSSQKKGGYLMLVALIYHVNILILILTIW